MQSDKPRDPTFIPTVFTIDAPAGVTVQGIAYPPASELRQEGLEQPLDVFGSEFAIGAELTVSGAVAPGPLVVPARLRYQACDDKVCYPPTTGAIEFTVQVVPTSTAITTAHAEVFKSMTFAAAAPAAAADPIARPPRRQTAGAALRGSRPSRSWRRPAVTCRAATSCSSSGTPNPASSRRGCSTAGDRSRFS